MDINFYLTRTSAYGDQVWLSKNKQCHCKSFRFKFSFQVKTKMASVDGSRSLQGASDELYDAICGPCKLTTLRGKPGITVKIAHSIFVISAEITIENCL